MRKFPPTALSLFAVTLVASLGFFLFPAGTALAEDRPEDPRVAALFELLPIEYGEKTKAAGKQIAELFERDPDLALKTLHQLREKQAAAMAKAYPKSRLGTRFDDRLSWISDLVMSEALDQSKSRRQRLKLLAGILQDEILSRELDYDLSSINFGFDQDKLDRDPAPYRHVPWEKSFHAALNDDLARLCLAAPDNLPRVVLIPAILLVLDNFSVPAWEPSERFPDIPERFEALRRPANHLAVLFREHPPDWTAPDIEPVLTSWLDEIETAALPANVRFSFARSAIDHLEWHLPCSSASRFARWLAEAWEDHAAVDFITEERILEHFTYAGESPNRAAVITRLLAAWERRQQKLDAEEEAIGGPERGLYSLDFSTVSWLAALAMESERHEAKDRLLKSIAGYRNDPISDPLFAVLIRGGEFERARQILTETDSIHFKVGNGFSISTGSGWFDAEMEKNLKAFAETLPEKSEHRYLVRLRMATLRDLPSAKLTADRQTRLRNLAREFDIVPFQTAPAKQTALATLAGHPEAAGLISEHFVSFARFNQIAEHHRSIRADTWSDLAGHTLIALLEAARYDKALALLEHINRHTISRDEAYQRTWRELASKLEEFYLRHQKNLEAVAGSRPVVAMLLTRPDGYFSKGYSHVRKSLLRASLDLEIALGTEANWWQWRSTLDPEFRHTLDHQLVNFSDEPPPPRHARTQDSASLALIEVFDAVPPPEPVTKRAAAVLKFLRSDRARDADGTPFLSLFASIVETYHYFSPAELLSLGPDIAAALDHSSYFCYTLACLAHEEEDTELSRRWLKRAQEAYSIEEATKSGK